MLRRQFRLRLVALVIAVAAMFSFISLTASAVGDTIHDYSRPGSQHTVTLDSADILEKLLGTELPSAERNYLVAYGEDKLIYDDGITTSYVYANYNKENDILSVSAREYKYLTESGAEIVWVPTRATLLGVTKELLEGSGYTYDAVFENVPDSDDTAAVRVEYILDITVSEELANKLLNKAYNDASEWQEYMDSANRDYENALSEYTEAKAEYDAYLAALAKHTEDTAAYKAYIIAKRDYDAALKRYNDYLAAKALYETRVEQYEDYLSAMEQYKSDYAVYSNYLNEYKRYENLYAVYQSQVDTVALCRSHLAIIELTKVKMTSLNRDIYSSVVESTLVDRVLYERDTLENLPTVKVPAKVIDLADSTTKQLRILLKEYFALTTETARYNYYAANFDKFYSAFNGLFDSLYYLAAQDFMGIYNNQEIGGVDTGDKYGKLQILIAQLYLVCMAISDGPVETIDPSYLNKNAKKKTLTPSNLRIGYIGGEKTLAQLIGDHTSYITDTDKAQPITTGFPSVGDEPTPPTPVTEPTMPSYVAEPVAPTVVNDPGAAPESVDDPGEAPEEKTEPNEPTSPTFPDEIVELCSAYNDTVVYRSTTFTDSVAFRVETSVDKRFINVETVDILYHGTDGKLLCSVTVDKGTYADYDYSKGIPTKEEDPRAIYTFAGWQTQDGTRVDITCVEDDMKLYPYFEETLKYYTVSWNIEGEIKQEKLAYGAFPSYTGTPKKASTGEHRYIFDGWSPEITEVVGDIMYTAQFREQEILPSVPGVTVTYDGENFSFDAKGSLVRDFDLEGIFELRTPFSEASIYTSYANVYLTPQLLDKLEAAGAASLSIDTVAMGNTMRSYTVRVLDGNGEPVELESADIEISFRMPSEDYRRLRVRHVDENGNVTVISYTVSEDIISFFGNPNLEYSVGNEYVAHAVSSDFANITTQNASYFAGDTVKVNLDLGVGKRIVKLFYRTSDGSESIIYNRTFVMPEEDVTIVAVVEEIMCNITFVSEGSIFSTVLVPYGNLPTPPAESPKKAGDENYEYVFEGWSPELSEATEDTVYVAVYRAVPVEKVETVDRLTIYEMLTIAVAAVFVILLGTVVCIGIAVIRRFRG